MSLGSTNSSHFSSSSSTSTKNNRTAATASLSSQSSIQSAAPQSDEVTPHHSQCFLSASIFSSTNGTTNNNGTSTSIGQLHHQREMRPAPVEQRRCATDGPPTRRKSSNNIVDPLKLISAGTPQPQKKESRGGGEQSGMALGRLTERCVVVARQPDGFGLTVTGEHPIKVATVKVNGAAHMAGVREGDRILKVNGMPVTGDNFQEVIKMISGGYNLALTLLGPARAANSTSWDDDLFPTIQPQSVHANHHPVTSPAMPRMSTGDFSTISASSAHRLSSTSLNSDDKVFLMDAEWRHQRANELFRMLCRERQQLEALQLEAEHDADIQDHHHQHSNKFDKALCRINELERQLRILTLLNSVNDSADDGHNGGGNGQCMVGSEVTTQIAAAASTAAAQQQQQSSKTFPPAALRTQRPTTASATNATAAAAAAVAASKVEPIRSWVETGGMHYVQAELLPIVGDDEAEEEDGGEDEAMEEEEDNNSELGTTHRDEMASGPFASLPDLKGRPAHLAVFFTYLLNNANPSSLLFYLISDTYPGSNAKEMRRFAYELFSTFLIPGAPLQLPNIAQRDIQAIDKALQSASASGGRSPADVDQLRKLFIPARTHAVGHINDQLAQFRRKRHFDSTIVGIEAAQLEALARADHTTEVRLAERLLCRALLHLAQLANSNGSGGPTDWENCERKTLALLISVATLIKVVLGLRVSQSTSEKLLDKCPTFLTAAPKSGGATSMFKMRSSTVSAKAKIHVKDHQFVLQPVVLTVHCYQCRELVWGVNPQAYFCQNCDVVVHKSCTSKLLDHCWPQQQQKAKSNSGAPASQQQQQQQSAPPTAHLKQPNFVAGSTTSLLSAPPGGQSSHLPPPFNVPSAHHSARHNHQRDSIFSSTYPHSVLGTETSSLGVAQLILHQQQQQQQKKQHSSKKSSISLTPPLHRSHHSITPSAVGMAGSKQSSSIDWHYQHHHGNDLPELIDADIVSSSQKTSRAGIPLADSLLIGGAHPPLHLQHLPSSVSAINILRQQHHHNHHSSSQIGSLDSSSSPPSSAAMLPPPVFSTKFERILPPDIPPSAAPPPPPPTQPPPPLSPEECIPQQQLAVNNLLVQSNNMPTQSPTTKTPGGGGEQVKSMDSGIGIDSAATAAAAATATATMSTARVESEAQQQSPLPQAVAHSIASATRSQSLKQSEAANQLRRGGKGGAGSLGAADAADDGYERPIGSQLAIPSPSSLKSSSSSAQDLSQALSEFKQLVRVGVESVAVASSSTTTGTTSNEEETRRQMLERVERMVVADGDSDLEVETEVPSLESLVSWEVLKHLKPKEKKRQEVINEFFHTERTHVRNLKILYKVFYRPMVLQRIAPPELIKLLFSNLDELLQIHSEMYQRIKVAIEVWRREGVADGGVYGDVGELVEAMFDGATGERLMQATALFCQNQQHALDTLRQRYSRSKDDTLSQFLTEAESNPLCRKFQLKDMIPVEMQRLVKYPLLLETIAKYTREGSDELQRVLHGVECAKRILSEVNSAKRTAENIKRMDELQRRLDFTGCEKSFFQKFDFRMHKLIYEGPLQWRQARGKALDLHVVLLEHLLVFLTKIGPTESGVGSQQRLQLKIHEAGCIPIMRLASVEVEEKLADKRSFNLLYKCDLRIFELVATTATERKTWFRLIENQVAVTRACPAAANTANVFLDDILSSANGSAISTNAILGNAGRATPPQQAQRVRVVEDGATAMAKVEHVHVLTHPALVNANEIVVQQPTVIENVVQQPPAAPPALSMSERLTKSDKMILAGLAEKHRVLADLLADEVKKGNTEELERITEQMTGLSVAELKQRNPKELAMSAIVHGNRLLECINKGMSVKQPSNDESGGDNGGNAGDGTKLLVVDSSERHLPSVPCYRLTAVAAPLMNHLKAMLQVIQDQNAELNRLKQQGVDAAWRTASQETLTVVENNTNNRLSAGGPVRTESTRCVAMHHIQQPSLVGLRAVPSAPNMPSSSTTTNNSGSGECGKFPVD